MRLTGLLVKVTLLRKIVSVVTAVAYHYQKRWHDERVIKNIVNKQQTKKRLTPTLTDKHNRSAMLCKWMKV